MVIIIITFIVLYIEKFIYTRNKTFNKIIKNMATNLNLLYYNL